MKRVNTRPTSTQLAALFPLLLLFRSYLCCRFTCEQEKPLNPLINMVEENRLVHFNCPRGVKKEYMLTDGTRRNYSNDTYNEGTQSPCQCLYDAIREVPEHGFSCQNP